MKRKIIRPHNQGHKILQQESGKLKEKLESLKQQIQQKKKEKEMKQNQLQDSRSAPRSILSKSRSRPSLAPEAQDLNKFLATLQMDHLASKLNEKSISSLEQLKAIQPETLDQWKDIPVGYRIKLKKQLNPARISRSPSLKSQSAEKQKLIEEIVEVRKKDKVYEPLPREVEQDDQLVPGYELSENQQEEMIQSLMDAFKQNDQIQEIHLSPSAKPKVIIKSKQAWKQREDFPNYKYCWTCLKKVEEQQTYQDRSFCGQNCLWTYKEVIQIEQNSQIFEQIQETENQFSKYLQQKKEKPKNQRAGRKLQGNKEAEIEIDFEIL